MRGKNGSDELKRKSEDRAKREELEVLSFMLRDKFEDKLILSSMQSSIVE